jgi:hypothetical protein
MKAKQGEKTKKATDQPTQRHWQEMNRKQRREMMRKIQSEDISLEVIHPDAAGIDIGNESHYVAVPPSRDSQPVRRFGCTTAELKAMADWLKQCGIRTVAMQSTGVYWIDEAAHLWTVTKFVSAIAGDSHDADLLAAAG